MISNSDLAYINANGKTVNGTAALLHRMFGKQPNFQEQYDREAELEECKRIIVESGYATFDE